MAFVRFAYSCVVCLCVCVIPSFLCVPQHRYHICHICISDITLMNRACIGAYLTLPICLQLHLYVSPLCVCLSL